MCFTSVGFSGTMAWAEGAVCGCGPVSVSPLSLCVGACPMPATGTFPSFWLVPRHRYIKAGTRYSTSGAGVLFHSVSGAILLCCLVPHQHPWPSENTPLKTDGLIHPFPPVTGCSIPLVCLIQRAQGCLPRPK